MALPKQQYKMICNIILFIMILYMKIYFGKCNIPYCPEKLNDKDTKILNAVILKTIKNKTDDWYIKHLNYLSSIQKTLLNYPNYNYYEIFGLKNHLELFRLEDENIKSIEIYLNFLLNKYTDMIKIDYKNITKVYRQFKNLLLFIKDHINDPRPYQVLYYFKDINLDVYQSNSSQTGSAPSGHCFSGFLEGYLIYISNEKFFNNNLYEFNRLLDIMIDIGLHRCMTGIHFMYDNYLSFILFIEILKEYNYNIDNKYITELKKRLKNIFLESID
jgi:hypothetical protein